MIPTEHEGTVAVDAAARYAYNRWAEAIRAQSRSPAIPTPEFDNLGPLDQNAWRDTVLMIVWTALEALPDRAEGAGERIAVEIEKARDAHWQEHLRLHPYAGPDSCPDDYAAHGAYADAANIARGEKVGG